MEPEIDKSKSSVNGSFDFGTCPETLPIEENFDSLCKHHTVQKHLLFRTINHLEELEKVESRRKLKKLRKLSNNLSLYFKCLEHFEKIFDVSSFKFNFLELCNNFVPDFENLNYLLHFNTSNSIKESSSGKSESKQGCSKSSCKNACVRIRNGTSKLINSQNIEGEINANGNQAILLENRLKGNFVSKNVVSLSKQNFNDAEIS